MRKSRFSHVARHEKDCPSFAAAHEKRFYLNLCRVSFGGRKRH